MDDADARAEQIIMNVAKGKAVPGSHFMHGPVTLPCDARKEIAAALREARRQGLRDAAEICDATATEIAEKGLGADNPDTFLAGAGYALTRAAQAIEARTTGEGE